MGGSRRGNEDSLGAAVFHAVLGVLEKLDGRREIRRGPFVATRLSVAGSDEFNARLLENENVGTNGTETAEADQGELETRLSGHLVWFGYGRVSCRRKKDALGQVSMAI